MMRWAVLAFAVVLVGAGDLVYVTGEEVPELEILEPVDGSVVRLLEGESAVMKFGVNFLKGQCNALECMRASVSGLRARCCVCTCANVMAVELCLRLCTDVNA